MFQNIAQHYGILELALHSNIFKHAPDASKRMHENTLRTVPENKHLCLLPV